MDKIRRLISLVFGVLALTALAGCSGPGPVYGGSPAETPTAPPSALDTPTPIPTLSPTATPAPTAVLTTVPAPQPHPTPAWAPYEDEPFTVVFQRDGELWLSEVGGRGERQLTYDSTYTGETPYFGVVSFAVSPDGRSIAYIVHDERNDFVKVVDVSGGGARMIGSTSEPDRVVSFGSSSGPPVWWDDTHIVYYILEPPPTREDDTYRMKSLIVVNLETGESTVEPFSTFQYPSPDGRYVLSELPYQLYDRETGEQWTVIEKEEDAGFLRWSPDGRLMLFNLTYELEESGVSDLRVLLVVDAETRARWVVTPEDKVALNAVWSPDGQAIAYLQCDPPTTGCGNPELWLTSPDGTDRHRIPIESMHCSPIAWTPDGTRLVLETNREPAIWSVRVDGSDLRPIADGQNPQVLPSP